MKIATALCGLATFGLVTGGFAVADVNALTPPAPGYKVVELTWKVETTPGRPTVQLKGTVQQVHEQLMHINPNYEQEFNITPVSTTSTLSSRDVSRLGKRLPLYCNIFPLAEADVPGQPSNGPGPGNCGRVSCSYYSAIWWCNDNPYPKTLDWNNIADSAQFTLNNCPNQGFRGIWFLKSGQLFNDGGWNTIIQYAIC